MFPSGSTVRKKPDANAVFSQYVSLVPISRTALAAVRAQVCVAEPGQVSKRLITGGA